MGTSSSQRSPATPEWERVRELYREPDASPGQIASRIVTSLDAQTRADLAGPGVASCLSSLLRASRQAATAGLEQIWQSHPSAQGPAVLRLAQALRQDAERQIVAHGYASRLADIGLNALGTSVLEVAAGGAPGFMDVAEAEAGANLGAFARDGRQAELSQCFLSHEFDHLFRYLVSRDLSDFIGSPVLPTVAHGSRLRDAVALHCRQLARRVPAAAYEAVFQEAVLADEDESRQQVEQVLQQLTDVGLGEIATAGG
jgi:hypothetical protein